jgi:hypothetical protein
MVDPEVGHFGASQCPLPSSPNVLVVLVEFRSLGKRNGRSPEIATLERLNGQWR